MRKQSFKPLNDRQNNELHETSADYGGGGTANFNKTATSLPKKLRSKSNNENSDSRVALKIKPLKSSLPASIGSVESNETLANIKVIPMGKVIHRKFH